MTTRNRVSAVAFRDGPADLMSNILIVAAAVIVVVIIFRFAFPRQFLRLVLLAVRRIMGLKTRSVEFDGINYRDILLSKKRLIASFCNDLACMLVQIRAARARFRHDIFSDETS